MERPLVIESIDFVNYEYFLVYFSDGTYVSITGTELKDRFADRISELPVPDDWGFCVTWVNIAAYREGCHG